MFVCLDIPQYADLGIVNQLLALTRPLYRVRFFVDDLGKDRRSRFNFGFERRVKTYRFGNGI